jgi:hypothetical protein
MRRNLAETGFRARTAYSRNDPIRQSCA